MLTNIVNNNMIRSVILCTKNNKDGVKFEKIHMKKLIFLLLVAVNIPSSLASTQPSIPNVEFDCSGNKIRVGYTLFAALMMSNGAGSNITGNEVYDKKMKTAITENFSYNDSNLILEKIVANAAIMQALEEQSIELQSRNINGANYLYSLVDFYLNKKNGLCE